MLSFIVDFFWKTKIAKASLTIQIFFSIHLLLSCLFYTIVITVWKTNAINK